MYEYIKGTLISKYENYVVIECNGIGYKIITSANSIQHINQKEVTFYTYLYVREDIFDLYGFSTPEERKMFELLIGVNGVGPKAAINILSCLSPSNLSIAIVTNTPKSISAANGIGPKMAQKIILELKDKIKNNDILKADDNPISEINDNNEAILALTSLGYSPQDASVAVSKAPKDLSLEETIKFALKQFIK